MKRLVQREEGEKVVERERDREEKKKYLEMIAEE